MSAVQRQSTRSEHEASTQRLRSQRSAREVNLVEEIKRNWREGSAVDALEALRANPELRERKSLVVDLAYEEFCLRRESGEAVDAEQFAGRFARFQASVRRRLEVHELLGSLDLSQGLASTTIWPVAGESFAGFRLIEEIGRGAFARVFLATDPDLGDREVVLKVTAIAEREARLLGQLKHPNIVTVHSVRYDAESGLSAICMAYHGRATLCDLLDRAIAETSPRRLADLIKQIARADADVAVTAEGSTSGSFDEQVVGLVAQIADALSYAHSRGIQHRDLKPSNILLDWSGRPMLLDFNLSVDPDEAHRNLGGTLPYMAPEMVAGITGEDVDVAPEYGERADIFALGVVLCELLTGNVPFPPDKHGAPVPLETVAQQHLLHQRGGPRLPACPMLQTDRRLWSVVERCVAFEPEKRPASSAEVARELRRYLNWRGRARRWAVRHRALLACAAATLLCVAGMGTAWWWNRPPLAIRASQAGIAAYREGQHKQAIALLTEATDAGNSDFEVLVARGRANQALGKYALACDDYFSALKLAPNAEVHAATAYCLAKHQYFDSAVYHAEQAIKLGFNTAIVWHIRGYSAYRTMSKDRVPEYLDKAIELDPTLQQAWLSRAHVQLNRVLNSNVIPEAAMIDIERALEVGPDTGLARSLAATIYARAAVIDPQWADAAIDHLDAAVRLGLDPGTIASDLRFASLKSHPRFISLAGRRYVPSDRFSSEPFQDPLADGHLPLVVSKVGG